MRICEIEGCNNKHEAKGYCKKHYKSFLKYGDPLHVERERANRQANKVKKVSRRTRISREGVCSVKGCGEPIQSKTFCRVHYQRFLKTGTVEMQKKRNVIKVEQCLVFGCEKIPKRHGMCSTHLIYIRETKTPYKPKIVKLCGVEGCNEIHYGRGLCEKHYVKWKMVVRDFKLRNYFDLD